MQWPSLKCLNVIDTDNLTCQAIAAIQRPSLRIYSHCIDCSVGAAEAPKPIVDNRTLLITLYCLAASYVFVVAVGFTTVENGAEKGGHGILSQKDKHDVRGKATSPLSMSLAGPSGCGKTSFVSSLLAEAWRLVDQPFDYIVCFLGSNDSKLRELSSVYWGRIQFVRGLPESFEQYIDAIKRGCFVLDDLMNQGTKNEWVSQLYIKLCHHSNVSVALILQNLFHHGKERYTILCNSHYLVILNTPPD